MIAITLPDGSRREFDNPVKVADVAASIGAGLAKAALAGKVDGKLVDTSFRIDHDASLEIGTCRARLDSISRTTKKRREGACLPLRRMRQPASWCFNGGRW